MTDEQIKQKAEEYCDEYFSPLDVDRRQYAEEDFIAGYYSCDEEIKELEQALAFTEDVVDIQKKELNQLRNPWISVKERLPEKIKNKGVSKYVFVTWPDGTRGEAYYNYEEYKAPRWEIKGAGITKPAYWMPIPQIEKEK